jgi:hypothetical protein
LQALGSGSWNSPLEFGRHSISSLEWNFGQYFGAWRTFARCMGVLVKWIDRYVILCEVCVRSQALELAFLCVLLFFDVCVIWRQLGLGA